MDNNEATSTVLSRIHKLDPVNGSKIMGFILLKDPGEKEMIRLAFGPENLLISLINQVKSELGLLSNASSASSTPSPFIPISNPNRPHPHPLLESSPRIVVPNNGGLHLSPSSPSSPWLVSPKPSPFAGGGGNSSPHPFASASNLSYPPPFYQNEEELLFPEDVKNMDFNDQMISPGGRSDSMLFPFANCNANHHHLLHRRSVSVNDVFLGNGGQSDDANNVHGGFGWKPCMYFAKGFCKNGGGCKFVHGDFADSPPDGSPNFDGFDEMMRMKAIQNQRLAMASGAPHPYSNRCMAFLGDSPRSAAAAAAMMDDEYHTFGRCRHDRSNFGAFNYREHPNSSSRQIYLTFPADSTFKEEDVSNYFSSFGPVQDVRIPYQQKRMFGFVTFVYPETVKQILAKGNPHFVCDSRVLVKPYKEKGKLPDKKHHHMEMDEFPECFSPTGLDPREPYDLPFGRRMVFNSQDMLLRRKLEEQAELQQAIEYQGRRLMNLQLPEMLNHSPGHQLHRHPLAVIPMPFPPQAYPQIHPSLAHSTDGVPPEVLEGDSGNDEGVAPTVAADPQGSEDNGNNGNSSEVGKQNVPDLADSDPTGSNLEHILPDNLFASPKKSDQSLVCFDLPR